MRPEQILGLTFTRKAAGELGARIRNRLAELVRRLGRDDLIAGEPTVATYHSYAGRVVREHGVRAGYEPTSRLLTEAAGWQLADAVMRAYDGDMSAVTSAPSTVTDAVLRLSADLAEHLRTPDELAAWTGRFFAEVHGRSGKITKPVRDLLSRQQARLQLLPLVRAYAERKQALEAYDFGDQLLRAATVATGHPEVGVVERDRFRVVLLDEYQDTSHAQAVLLRALFSGGHPVTAVGDPCQSIYGWRGASAGTLERFPVEFRAADGTEAKMLSLTTSWRNRPEILDVANALSRPLREFGHRVAELAPADVVSPRAASQTVHCALVETYLDEARWLAGRILDSWRVTAKVPVQTLPIEIPEQLRPTTAVLVRTRAQIPAIVEALRAAGLPVEVVGLGGLLETPEVRDIVSMLRVLADPTEGAALLRILTGPRWRIGPRDLVALHRRAREIAAERQAACAIRSDRVVLVEALDDLGEPERYSAAGHQRFGHLAAELRRLRGRLDQSLPDLVADVERMTGLDVEVAVRPGEAGLARGHLDAFGVVAARFAGETDSATLGGFLAYLAAAETSERGLAPGEVEVVVGAVQILTAHAAKGLEWDVVAVAGLTADVFPGPSNSGDHWLRGLGVLPFPLRGDAAGLPTLDLSGAQDVKGIVKAIESFGVAWREHDVREERRLAYVAVTRPRRLLLASGYWWGEGTRRKRGPSPFLAEIRARCLAGAGVVDEWSPDPGRDAENPTAADVPRASWPADPLGGRRAALEEAAAMVRAAAGGEVLDAAGGEVLDAAGGEVLGAAGGAPARDPVADRWAYQARLLLAERAAGAPRLDAPVDVLLPEHLSVSQLVTIQRDPGVLARSLRRPMPTRQDPYARRGTAFHRWLEQRYAAEHLLDLDELPGSADEGAAGDDALGELRRRFEESPWADRVPVDVEVPFAMTIGGIVVRGRMDAVFAAPRGGAGGLRFEVVDWKTGAVASGAAARAASVQLAAYRLAWAARAAVPVEQVGAAFYYVRHDVTVRPTDLLDHAGLVALIASLPAASPIVSGGADDSGGDGTAVS